MTVLLWSGRRAARVPAMAISSCLGARQEHVNKNKTAEILFSVQDTPVIQGLGSTQGIVGRA